MSMCKICSKDSKVHSKEMWKLHQEPKLCVLCQKKSDSHSEELWELHQQAIKVGAKGEKLYPITLGFGPETIGRAHKWNMPEVNGRASPYALEIIPIHMHCRKCSLAMGQIEVDNADMLNGLCTECFCEETGQEYDSPFGEYFTGVSKGLDLARDWRPS